jgi:predicted small lipoprotein YifL
VNAVRPIRLLLSKQIISRIALGAAGLAMLALLSGCGHRGPLYMPGKPGDPAYDREHKNDNQNQNRSTPPYPMDDRTVNEPRS